ncbi:hypothetical protein NDU88_012321 [Pleurodeles waltl]|uniref:Uncharacterized protein n=1 Tax=Pleurodeles waltl TaxID=8319 RepID=A0AAV7QZT8_PLEWA|nr:hypothetical protein NDU88_012321 [Pleurodeles waltl]
MVAVCYCVWIKAQQDPPGRSQGDPRPWRPPRASSHPVPAGTSLAVPRRVRGRPTYLHWQSGSVLLRQGCRGSARSTGNTPAPSARLGATPPPAPILSPGPGSGLLHCESSVGKPRPLFAPPAPRFPQGALPRVSTGPGGPAPLFPNGAAVCQHAPLGSPSRRSMYLSLCRLYFRFAPGPSPGLLCCEGGSKSAHPLRIVPSPRLCHTVAPCLRLEPRLTSSLEHLDGSCDMSSA